MAEQIDSQGLNNREQDCGCGCGGGLCGTAQGDCGCGCGGDLWTNQQELVLVDAGQLAEIKQQAAR